MVLRHSWLNSTVISPFEDTLTPQVMRGIESKVA